MRIIWRVSRRLDGLRQIINRRIDLRVLKPFLRVVAPPQYSNLRFVAPTGALRAEMRRGPDREIETRQWIDGIPQTPASVLWDVGANVGSFCIYAATRGITVVAAEPAPQNLLLLVRNIQLNNVQRHCTVLPLAITDRDNPEDLKLSSFNFGAARNNFGDSVTSSSGGSNDLGNSFRLTGVTIQTAVNALRLPAPTHLKVDVDGIDDRVVFGAGHLLAGITEICCEVRFEESRVVALTDFLKGYGFRMKSRSLRNAFYARA